MARKQITTVYLERQPHREAKQRLRLAYACLIEEGQSEQPQIEEKGKIYLSHLRRSNDDCNRATPYGYRYVSMEEAGGSSWVVDEREIEAVRQIFACYTMRKN